MPVLLQTNHGAYRLEAAEGETVAQVLTRNGVPLSAVWTYVLESREEATGEAGTRRVHFVPASARVDAPEFEGRDLYARVTRNINLPGLLGFDAQKIRTVDQPTTEWTFPGADGGAFERVQCQLSAQDCYDFVCRSVEQVVAAWPAELPRKVIVGTSGGGDSNVLLSALMESGGLRPEDVVPVMMLGIPDWDTQLGNAREMCQSLGLELQVIEGAEAAGLARVRDFEQLKDSFVARYPDADLEFLGTWLLRRVLGKYATERGVSVVATGANREDIVAEGLARLVRGQAPLPAPYRRIGDVTFVYPIYKVPKKIGDGAYPTFSLENYEARNPSFSPGRSVFYYVAYQLADVAPGMDLSLLDGFAQLAERAPDPFEFNDSIGDYVVAGGYDDEQATRWSEFLQENAEDPASR